ncbi:MAG: helix-hairpin-helix domain-containing protein [Gallionella sp.]
MPLAPRERLEDLPNIGVAIAADLRAIGITQPAQIAQGDALQIYLALTAQMGKRHDPCVLYTLLAVQHFLRSDEKLAWWKFTEQGKALLAQQSSRD